MSKRLTVTLHVIASGYNYYSQGLAMVCTVHSTPYKPQGEY